MALRKERKVELVAEYTDLINQSSAVIFTEYRGLSNREMTELRRSVREVGGRLQVTKLSLFKLALEATGNPIPEELTGRPIAVGFCFEEIPGVAKALVDYSGDSEVFVVHGGLSEGAVMSEAQVKAIADLPPFDVLRAQLLGLLDAPASNLVGVVQAGVSSVVNVLNAYIEEGEAA